MTTYWIRSTVPLSDAQVAELAQTRRETDRFFDREIISKEKQDYLLSLPKFLVALNAYRLGRCTLAQVLEVAFSMDGDGYPAPLDPVVFADFAWDLAGKLSRGELLVDEDNKALYSHSTTNNRSEAPAATLVSAANPGTGTKPRPAA